MRCSEAAGAGGQGGARASAWRSRCAALAGGVQAHKSSDSYLQLDARPGALARALGHRPARPRRRARSRRRRRRQAHLGRGPHRLAADRGLRDGAPRDRRLRARRPASAASSGAATAPMRCCTCASTCTLPTPPAIRYALFAEVDPTHRGIAKIERPGEPVALSVLDPARARRSARRAAGSAASAATGSAAAAEPPSRWQFLEEGIRHILGGYDHVLFLLCLLLPAVMRRRGRALAAGRAAVAGDPAGGRHRHRVHRGALDHAGARRAEAGVAAVVVHRAGDRGDDRARRDRQRLAGVPGAAGGRRPSSSA